MIGCNTDCIQDSILERDRRLRNARDEQLKGRGPRDASWLWAQFTRAVKSGQKWFVVSLVGASPFHLYLRYFNQRR